MRLRRFPPLFWLVLALGPILAAQVATPYDKIVVTVASTSIYIGKVTLIVSPLTRKDGVYSGTYHAKVFPYWFMSEQGTFRMKVSDEELARVAKGETVEFSGEAENTGSEPRKVSGRAVPDDATKGAIKVRIYVTEKIQLIFNTRYRFAE